MADSPFHLRSVPAQVDMLTRSLKALVPAHREPILECAAHLAKNLAASKRHPWLAVILNPSVYGVHTPLLALEAWEKPLPGGTAVEIPCLRTSMASFRADDFWQVPETKTALEHLAQVQGKNLLLVVPVRVELVNPDRLDARRLESGEFDFDLSSVLSFLAADAAHGQTDIMFAALGERYSSARHRAAKRAEGKTELDLDIPTAGYRRHDRRVDHRPASELRNYYALTGFVPY